MPDPIQTSFEDARERVPSSLEDARKSLPTVLEEVKHVLASLEDAVNGLPSSRAEVMARMQRRPSKRKRFLRAGMTGALLLGGAFVGWRVFSMLAPRARRSLDMDSTS